jgi:hypothetical protein
MINSFVRTVRFCQSLGDRRAIIHWALTIMDLTGANRKHYLVGAPAPGATSRDVDYSRMGHEIRNRGVDVRSLRWNGYFTCAPAMLGVQLPSDHCHRDNGNKEEERKYSNNTCANCCYFGDTLHAMRLQRGGTESDTLTPSRFARRRFLINSFVLSSTSG